MRKILLSILVCIVAIPVISFAQESGTFIGSLGLGLTSAQGQFSDPDLFAAGSGFGAEAQAMFYPIGGFGIGGLVNYLRFGSSYPGIEGRTSFNFDQIGGLAKLNLIPLHNGTIYAVGGGGSFTPSVHNYIPEASTDRAGDKSGWFGFGGVGLSSSTDRRTIYEMELKYNVGRADFTLDNKTSNVWDFIYLGVKLSFASKGKGAPTGY